MNLITDLAEQADFYVGNEHYEESHEEKQRIWTEKFAQLVVLECINILQNTYAPDDHLPQEEIVGCLKQRFGLK